MTQRRTGYVICAEHRSGSTLLCQMLSSTGTLGRPDEIFRNSELCVDVERNPALFDDILRSVTTDNGIYGIKVFSNQFDVTMRARWIERLDDPVFVYLERRDILAQAISYVKAIQTKKYVASETAGGSVRYDANLIAANLARIADSGARWRRYFARNGIVPVYLVYEKMIEHPDRAVARIAAALGLAPPVLQAELISLAIQRDAVTSEWKRRFEQDKGDIGYLDATLGPLRTRLRRAARDLWYVTRSARRW